ncbi:MAG: hypothetical protein HUU02_15005 [Bacteroidetes bacterium]|nr:hypothetical protein [Bacteroidota bacterium]
MKSIHRHSAQLRSIILSILTDSHSPAQTKELVMLCHAFALVLLKSKLAAGRLNLNLVNIEVHDLAYDCIAEIFQSDTHNELVQLKAYFGSISMEATSDIELVDLVRRLVFSKVNQGIYRIYFEYDPSLGKIIRNMKIAIQSLGNFNEVDRFGEMLIATSVIDPQLHLPVLPAEELDRMICDIVHGSERIPEIMARLFRHLSSQSEYAKAVPLVPLALSIRRSFVQESAEQYAPDLRSLDESDIRTLIAESISTVKIKYSDKYVGRMKLTNKEYDAMFNVVERNLTAIAIELDGKDYSLYDNYAAEIEGLSKSIYHDRYKAILEYLFSLCKSELGKRIKLE